MPAYRSLSIHIAMSVPACNDQPRSGSMQMSETRNRKQGWSNQRNSSWDRISKELANGQNARPPAFCRGPFPSVRVGSGGRTRTCDLRVMSPTSCRCSTPRRGIARAGKLPDGRTVLASQAGVRLLLRSQRAPRPPTLPPSAQPVMRSPQPHHSEALSAIQLKSEPCFSARINVGQALDRLVRLS